LFFYISDGWKYAFEEAMAMRKTCSMDSGDIKKADREKKGEIIIEKKTIE
jgi:hypothetical protein